MKIIVQKNLEKDLKNWHMALEATDFREKIINSFKDSDGRLIFESNPTSNELEKKIKHTYYGEKINDVLQRTQYEYNQKWQNIVDVLEDITKRPCCVQELTIILTTLPFMRYSYTDYMFYYYILQNEPIKVALHELLHYQTLYYWRNNGKSRMSRLNEKDFIKLNESLTVVIDDAIPIAESPDNGYPEHAQLRSRLYKIWQQYHDFDMLINEGCTMIRNDSQKS